MLGSMDPQFQMVMNFHVGTGNKTPVLCKSIKCSYLWSQLSLHSHFKRRLMFGLVTKKNEHSILLPKLVP